MRDAARCRSFRPFIIPAAALALAGCGGDRMSGLDLGSTGATQAAAATRGPSPPPTDLNGRWMLSSAGGGTCRMTFAGSPGVGEGTIRPEGGCPGNFFTSRKWTFEDGALILRNHNSEPLGQLRPSGQAAFAGDATSGQQVSLSR